MNGIGSMTSEVSWKSRVVFKESLGAQEEAEAKDKAFNELKASIEAFKKALLGEDQNEPGWNDDPEKEDGLDIATWNDYMKPFLKRVGENMSRLKAKDLKSLADGLAELAEEGDRKDIHTGLKELTKEADPEPPIGTPEWIDWKQRQGKANSSGY